MNVCTKVQTFHSMSLNLCLPHIGTTWKVRRSPKSLEFSSRHQVVVEIFQFRFWTERRCSPWRGMTKKVESHLLSLLFPAGLINKCEIGKFKFLKGSKPARCYILLVEDNFPMFNLYSMSNKPNGRRGCVLFFLSKKVKIWNEEDVKSWGLRCFQVNGALKR